MACQFSEGWSGTALRCVRDMASKNDGWLKYKSHNGWNLQTQSKYDFYTLIDLYVCDPFFRVYVYDLG